MDCCCFWYVLSASPVLVFLSYLIFNKLFAPGQSPNLLGKHVMVTGGSSGIGLAVAQEVARLGAHVTLVARNQEKLVEAQQTVQATANKAKVLIRPFDVCSDGVEGMVADAETALGPIFMLVNCAGYSTPARFEDLSMQEVKRMMDVNFFGTFAVTQAVVRRMKQRSVSDSRERQGIVVLTSSQGGMLGIYGFTAYAAAKAALIKFAEALHMEVQTSGLSVTVSVPPDTDTPGFEKENVSKPTETRLVSETAGLFSAEVVAKSLVRDALAGRFYTTVGIEGFMLTTLCAGMGPITYFWDFFAQVFLTGVFRFISSFFLLNFDHIVRKEYAKRMNDKKRE
ncbi:3-ketodihydrosphingosine reductase-like isoform X2 [Hyalella azteca]|uniref:3-dehydrosphinganine reductase n=1 Tax=Hyalella azteca TaxID=294128 RepID=A0A8B7P9F5_HYAAZ|nr:3-ketodihydrosphingosine reductase-like isoform X2 [Hyalella azteca]